MRVSNAVSVVDSAIGDLFTIGILRSDAESSTYSPTFPASLYDFFTKAPSNKGLVVKIRISRLYGVLRV